jgi:hypothetical protein
MCWKKLENEASINGAIKYCIKKILKDLEGVSG